MGHALTLIHDMDDRDTLGRQVVGNHGAMTMLGESFGTEHGGGPDTGQRQQFGHSLVKRRRGHMIGVGAR